MIVRLTLKGKSCINLHVKFIFYFFGDVLWNCEE